MRGEFKKDMKENKKNKKCKENQNTLAKYLLARIALATIIGIIVYIIIYLFFYVKGVIPPGDGLDKTDWLSFFGAYLSFFGTVIISLTIFWHTNYMAKKSEEKNAAERKKRIQPIFSIKIRNKDIKLHRKASPVDLSDSIGIPHNFEITIENVSEFPITNFIVFDKYITTVLKPGEKENIVCSYSDTTNTLRFSPSVIIINETDYDMSENGLPNWFNINYDDVDGNSMYQTFILKEFAETEYFSLEGIYEA